MKPEHLADKVIVCGDPARVDNIASFLTDIECNISSREFHSITGQYKGKRITVLSHGIGGDNIEIVMNELDMLANVDFETRMVKDRFRKLEVIRIGTSGGLQDTTPIGTYVAARYAIGFDGVLNFYAGRDTVCDTAFEKELLKQLDWKIKGLLPYVVKAPDSLVERICKEDILRGATVAANGFYAPQGRKLRFELADPELNRKIQAFSWNDQVITNFEMESSALAGIGAILGHDVLTVCCIIAGRKAQKMNVDYKQSLQDLIQIVLERI